MRATINREGFLIIQAETELEGYALSRWAADQVTGKFPKIEYRTGKPEGQLFNLEIDESLPSGEIQLRHNGKILARITEVE